MSLDLSVIVPTLNEGKYIGFCLKALANQTLPREKYEIILVDSYSNDNTVKISEKYVDKIVFVPRNGPGYARNVGAKIANGRILVFIDADTVASKDLLEKILRAFTDDKIVGGTCFYHPDSTRLFDRFIYITANNLTKLCDMLFLRNIAAVPGFICFIRKDVFEDIGGFDESLTVFEDHDLGIRMKKKGKIIYLDETYVMTSIRRNKALGYSRIIPLYMYVHLVSLLGKPPKIYYPAIRTEKPLHVNNTYPFLPTKRIILTTMFFAVCLALLLLLSPQKLLDYALYLFYLLKSLKHSFLKSYTSKSVNL